ncbi:MULTISPECIES: ABC transporter permease [Streptomyces]|uniref:ABC transporter n=1 Tax=Streptomyces nigrescens TaxID=1920 RepID=A0A640TQ02_STRNI|nr:MULTISPECIES: FtsX-like permease family protein [Streptomyces]WAT98618.1 FtsX-like permease family protein [Streptomyces libani subsp. libani]WDT55599.1 FtsX-like permease family protein [Streptomyces sp. G7(2002)]GFE24256.1 ABC transporter [Streptomyces libani subsp. libani]GGW00328.1 ABC transporter [Streptomyces libani subsp. libani]
MFKTALRNVLAHKARLLMTVLAVMLGVAFVSGTLVFTETVSQASQAQSRQDLRDVDVALHAPSGNGSGAPVIDQKLLDKSARVPGAASATGLISGFTGIADKNGALIGNPNSSNGGNYFPGADGKDARYPMRDGAAPHGPHEFALDASTADKAGYKVGDTVRLSANGPVHEQKLTGIFTTDDGGVAAGGSLALFDTPTAQKLLGAPGGFQQIRIKADPGTSQTALKSAVESALPKGSVEATTGKQLADDLGKMNAKRASDMQTYLLVFAGIALFVGIFLIANTFTMLVAQRTRELALLRAVGASRRQVTRSVLTEAFVVGAIASVVGFAAGIGVGAGLRALMGSMSGNVPEGPLVVPMSAVLTSLLVGTLVTVLAAWLPGRRASKIPPIAAMNSVHATATTKSLVLRNTIGALFAGAGVAVVLYGTGGSAGKNVNLVLAGGATLLMIGVFVLTPLLSRPLIALAAPVLRIFGVAGTLARQNSVRNPRRTAATASALMVGLTLITGLTVVATSVQTAIEKQAVASLKSDYVVSMAGPVPLSPDVAKKLRTLDEVTAVSPLRQSFADHTMLTGVTGKDFDKVARLDFTQGSLGTIQGNQVVVDSKTAEEKGLHPGSRFPVTFADGKKSTLTVSGVYEGNDLINGVILDNATLAPHEKTADDSRVLVKTKDGATDATKDALITALGKNPALSVADKQEVTEAIAGMVSLMLNMLYALLAMAVIVAVLGVINTLAMSVFERSQEIGMLRAIGLDRPGIKRMVRLESLVISLFGGVLGIGLGVFFGWAAGPLISSDMPTYALVLPWGRLGLFFAAAALIGVLAALWPARRAARLNMLTAIKAE